jgi:hypothetical protein
MNGMHGTPPGLPFHCQSDDFPGSTWLQRFSVGSPIFSTSFNRRSSCPGVQRGHRPSLITASSGQWVDTGNTGPGRPRNTWVSSSSSPQTIENNVFEVVRGAELTLSGYVAHPFAIESIVPEQNRQRARSGRFLKEADVWGAHVVKCSDDVSVHVGHGFLIRTLIWKAPGTGSSEATKR